MKKNWAISLELIMTFHTTNNDKFIQFEMFKICTYNIIKYNIKNIYLFALMKINLYLL